MENGVPRNGCGTEAAGAGTAGAGRDAPAGMIVIVRRSRAPFVLVALMSTAPCPGCNGARYTPLGVTEPALARHATVGLSWTTSAASRMLVPATVLAGAPSIITLGCPPLSVVDRDAGSPSAAAEFVGLPAVPIAAFARKGLAAPEARPSAWKPTGPWL